MSNHTRIALPSLLAACAVSFLACGPAAAPSLRGEVGVFLRIEGSPSAAEREALAGVVASAGMRSEGGDRPARFEVVDELRAQVLVDVATQLRPQTEAGARGGVTARELRPDGRVSLRIAADGLVQAGLALDRELRALSDPAAVASMRPEGGAPTGGSTGPTAVESMRAEGGAPAEGPTAVASAQAELRPTSGDSTSGASSPTAETSMRAQLEPDRGSVGGVFIQ